MSRIVQAANFVTPRSGGLRTTLRHLAEGYADRGHDVVQVVPGRTDSETATPWGRVITIRSPEVPRTGYRIVAQPRAVARVLDQLRPDRLEVHDRSTLRRLGRWAAHHDVPALVVSHERLDRLASHWLPSALPLDRWADRSNRSLAAHFDRVVCTTRWAAEEFTRIGATNLYRVPLGVDLERFHPARENAAVRARFAAPEEALLLVASRLSPEKAPELAVQAVAELVRRGRRVRLVFAGDGPLRASLTRAAAGLPVTFLGFVADPAELAALLAAADVVIAPGPIETFGLAALEALASGTPVVARASSALPEVLGDPSGDPDVVPAGLAVDGTADAVADAVESLLAQPREQRCDAARDRAETFPWCATVRGFLSAHGLAEIGQRA